jgi:hypothetical protein
MHEAWPLYWRCRRGSSTFVFLLKVKDISLLTIDVDHGNDQIAQRSSVSDARWLTEDRWSCFCWRLVFVLMYR